MRDVTSKDVTTIVLLRHVPPGSETGSISAASPGTGHNPE